MEKINDKLLNWASILEVNTREQAELTSTMPFIHPYLALMPDAHLGKGSTVGSVIPTLGAIMPAAVGVDIGCGSPKYDWSNIDGKYSRDRDDWRQLCRSCHMKYDYRTGLRGAGRLSSAV